MNNLSKRVITSLSLFLLLFFAIFNDYIWLALSILVAIISFIEFKNLLNHIWHDTKKKYLINILVICYLALFVFILNNQPKNDILIILSVCILSDIGGYVFGKLIGGRKLTKISPNKTISGAVGSFICSLIPIIYFFYYQSNYSMYYSFEFKYLFLICVIFLLISLVCQLGDLFISYFKRRSKLKDTGKILPGHGGLLDRIDGIIFAVPFGILLANMI